jgi:hypothetical protein
MQFGLLVPFPTVSLNKQTNEQTTIQIFLCEVQAALLQSGRQRLHL